MLDGTLLTSKAYANGICSYIPDDYVGVGDISTLVTKKKAYHGFHTREIPI